MRVRSKKKKSVRLQNYVTNLVRSYWGLPSEDVRPAIMGDSGTDIKLSSKAKKLIPFDIECKNQERLNIWQAIRQAESNTGEGRIPLLVFKRNRSKVYTIIEFEKLLQVIKNVNRPFC